MNIKDNNIVKILRKKFNVFSHKYIIAEETAYLSTQIKLRNYILKGQCQAQVHVLNN